MKTNVIITGANTYDNYADLEQVCSDYIAHLIFDGMSTKDEITILSGMMQGAEKLGAQFARNNGLYCVTFAGDWQIDAATKVPNQNEQMVRFSVVGNTHGVMLAFWDGLCNSTKSMIALAEKHKLELFITLY